MTEQPNAAPDTPTPDVAFVFVDSEHYHRVIERPPPRPFVAACGDVKKFVVADMATARRRGAQPCPACYPDVSLIESGDVYIDQQGRLWCGLQLDEHGPKLYAPAQPAGYTLAELCAGGCSGECERPHSPLTRVHLVHDA